MPGKMARSRDQTLSGPLEAGSTAQPTYGLPRTPPSAIVHAVPGHLGNVGSGGSPCKMN